MSTRLLGADTYTATRYTVGTYVNGDWSHAVDSTFSVYGTFRSISPDEQQPKSEGIRSKQRANFYTEAVLHVASVESKQRGDSIVIEGLTYEVVGGENNTKHRRRLSHWKYEIEKVDLSEEALT
jgi:hypothetical protein